MTSTARDSIASTRVLPITSTRPRACETCLIRHIYINLSISSDNVSCNFFPCLSACSVYTTTADEPRATGRAWWRVLCLATLVLSFVELVSESTALQQQTGLGLFLDHVCPTPPYRRAGESSTDHILARRPQITYCLGHVHRGV